MTTQAKSTTDHNRSAQADQAKQRESAKREEQRASEQRQERDQQQGERQGKQHADRAEKAKRQQDAKEQTLRERLLAAAQQIERIVVEQSERRDIDDNARGRIQQELEEIRLVQGELKP